MTEKYVYAFEEGSEAMRDLLGGKGAGLSEMTRADLPVPPGFTVTTEACLAYLNEGETFPQGMWEEVLQAMKEVEGKTGKRFGDAADPLLVSVRSGAKFSMPGMMDTVLNVGLNDQTVEGLAQLTANERFAYDAYRRLLQMYGKVVLGVPGETFEDEIEELKHRRGVTQDVELTTADLQELVQTFKGIIRQKLGREFPQDPYEQLRLATEAVFKSWNRKRARDYRQFHGIPHDLGTAVNVVTMAFGNMGSDSGSGVAFTRDAATGEKRIYGEYLLNAQGEDVVSGARTPQPIERLKEEMPEAYAEFEAICEKLERHYKDVQDVEFTIERGKLYMLQTRTGKRTALAAVKVAVDLANEGIIDRVTAVRRVTPEQVDQLLHPRFEEETKEKARADGRFITKGLNASPGAAVGVAAFDADTAEAWGRDGRAVILVRPETNPDDVHGMLRAKGILTSRGGATSHAAVVARGLGKPCVAGAEEIKIDREGRTFSANGVTVREGEAISIDGTSGEVFLGELPTREPRFEDQPELQILLSWADESRSLGVWANADYPRDASRARTFGAEGIGLCRTEHMFFEEERLPVMRQVILNAGQAAPLLAEERAARAALEEDRFPDEAARDEGRKRLEKARQAVQRSEAVGRYLEGLDQLAEMQKGDFKGILEAMDGLPVIIRLIDPPMHEFLPSHEELLVRVTAARARGERDEEAERLLKQVEAMREANPMLGLRGVRLGVLYPEIVQMQVRAILTAAAELRAEGKDPHPEIMIPLTAHVNELKRMKEATQAVAADFPGIDYKFGTMIEIPRAAVTADRIAEVAEFFSYGTNDLTQTVYGISRDDAEGKFLLQYVDEGVLPSNPFQQLDREGVGEILRMGVERGRSVRPDLEVGICGEHGGDPSSIEFCHQVGLNYVSCSPFRVPVARLAAAHAALEKRFRDV